MPLSSLHFGKLYLAKGKPNWEHIVSMPLSSLHFGKLVGVAIVLPLLQLFPCR